MATKPAPAGRWPAGSSSCSARWRSRPWPRHCCCTTTWSRRGLRARGAPRHAAAVHLAAPRGCFNRWSHSIRAVDRRHREPQGPRLQRERDAQRGPDEIGDLIAEYNSLGDSLRARAAQTSTSASCCSTRSCRRRRSRSCSTNANDAIVFGNVAARQLFRAGRQARGAEVRRRCSRTRRSRCARRSKAARTRSSRCTKARRRKSSTSATGRSR